SMEQLDEGFTATAYLKVQESLKLAVEEQVLLEEPASSSGTLSSLQHLSRDFSFGDQFFSDKPLDADKNAETKVESMVNVTIQQALSSISLLISPIIDLTSRPESPKEHQQLKATTTNTTTATTTTLPPPQAQQQSTAEAMMLFEALEKSMNRDHSEELAQDLAEERKKKKKSPESPKTPPGSPSHQPPPPPPPAGPSGPSGAPGASGSSPPPPPPPPPSSTHLEMDEDMSPDEQAQLSDDEDIGSAHIPEVNLRQGWWKPLEEERPATPEPSWSISSSDAPRRGITELKPQDLEGPTFEIIKVFHPDVIHLQYQMEECHKLLTDNLDYLRYGSKGSRPALSISKMKAAYYLDAGLEQMVPYQFWINKECKYDIAAMVKEFRINRMNPGLNTRFWTRKDVDRCNAFMFAIQRRLTTRRIFRNLESFVGGRVREGDNRLLKRTD
nr:hypothetical protein [Tanacetum cinerariifolium]